MKRSFETSKEDEEKILQLIEEEEKKLKESKTKSSSTSLTKCPYLDTINRKVLDFDSKKFCSQTLSNKNIYACLVCGQLYNGKGKSTPAYTHSLQYNHYVFMNLESSRIYCLPDDYEIIDNSLQDIVYSNSPKFNYKTISNLNKFNTVCKDLDGNIYTPGLIGLNNLSATDYINVVLHLISHIKPLRNFFLQDNLFPFCKHKLITEFSLVLRKLWSSYNFKSTLSPQELIQTIILESKKKYNIFDRVDAMEFFFWLLTNLDLGLHETNKRIKPLLKAQAAALSSSSSSSSSTTSTIKAATPANKNSSSVIYEPIQGFIQVETLTKRLVSSYEEQKIIEAQISKDSSIEITEEGWERKVVEVPFSCLSLDIPPCPLFRDSHGSLVIPQIPLFELLSKYDGETWTDVVTKDAHIRKRYKILSLPRYLIFHFNRFKMNNFSLEKNPTIVNFAVRNFDMKDYLSSNSNNSFPKDSYTDLSSLKSSELEEFIIKYGSPLHLHELNALKENSSIDQSAFRENLLYISEEVLENNLLKSSTKYDLVANICHQSENSATNIAIGDASTGFAPPEKKKKKATSSEEDTEAIQNGIYKIHLNKPNLENILDTQWFELQDLHITETTPQVIGVSQSYILLFEKKL